MSAPPALAWPEDITICAVESMAFAAHGVALPLPLSWITPRPVMMQFASSVSRANWAKLPDQNGWLSGSFQISQYLMCECDFK